jgi:hypothetical protein
MQIILPLHQQGIYLPALLSGDTTFLTDTQFLSLSADAARLPGFHTCVGSGGEKLLPEWYSENGELPFPPPPVSKSHGVRSTLP